MAVRKLKSGYQVDYRIGRRRIRKGGFQTERAARSYLLSLRDRISERVNTLSKDLTIEQGFQRYFEIETKKKSELLQRMEMVWFRKFHSYLSLECGRRYVWEIELSDLQKYQLALLEHRSAGTVNRRFCSFKAFFNRCVDWGILKDSPARRLKRLPHRSEKRCLWTMDQIREVSKNLKSPYSEMFLFIAETGCRPGEARSLKWKDVDFINGLVTLRSIKGGVGERKRVFPLTKSLEKILLKAREISESSFVFSSKSGRMIQRDALQKKVSRLSAALSSNRLSVYGLRHTFITEALKRDYSIAKVMELVGHSKLDTTQGYTQIDFSSLKSMVEKLEQERGIEGF